MYGEAEVYVSHKKLSTFFFCDIIPTQMPQGDVCMQRNFVSPDFVPGRYFQ